jgi:hypothetical protein
MTRGAIVAAVLLLLGARGASAQEGVTEIDQARALAGSVTPGDGAGFPVTLSAPGAYRLSGSLTSTNPDFAIVRITSDDVMLDLAGFSLVGPTTCTGSPVTACNATGLGGGVVASGQRNVTVRNGTVRGGGLVGVNLGSDSRVENVAALENGTVGIFVDDGSTVVDCVASRNGERGISAENDVVVSGNVARHNGTDGIRTAAGATLSGNVASANGSDGIVSGTATTLAANVAYDNGDDGIQSSSGSVVGCAVASNADFGLSLGAASGFAQCVAGNNNAGDGNELQTAGGQQIGVNFCTSAAHDGAFTSILCP